MKSLFAIFVFLPAVSFAKAPSDQRIQCRLDQKSTDKLVALKQKGKKDPLVGSTEVNGFDITLKDGKVSDRSTLGGMKIGDDVATEGNLQADKAEQKGDILRINFSANGYDHLNWNFTINAKTKKASVREGIFYDCGEPSDAYGVYNCEITAQ